MKKDKNKQPVIKNLNDLALAKERYRYEVKLQEHSLLSYFEHFSINLKASVKETVNFALEKFIYATLVGIMNNLGGRNEK